MMLIGLCAIILLSVIALVLLIRLADTHRLIDVLFSAFEIQTKVNDDLVDRITKLEKGATK